MFSSQREGKRKRLVEILPSCPAVNEDLLPAEFLVQLEECLLRLANEERAELRARAGRLGVHNLVETQSM